MFTIDNLNNYTCFVEVENIVLGTNAGAYRGKCASTAYTFKDEAEADAVVAYINGGTATPLATKVYQELIEAGADKFVDEGLYCCECFAKFFEAFQAVADNYEDGQEIVAKLAECLGCITAFGEMISTNDGVTLEAPAYIKECYQGFYETAKAVLETKGCLELRNAKKISI